MLDLFLIASQKNPDERLLAYCKRNIRKHKNNAPKVRELKVLQKLATDNINKGGKIC